MVYKDAPRDINARTKEGIRMRLPGKLNLALLLCAFGAINWSLVGSNSRLVRLQAQGTPTTAKGAQPVPALNGVPVFEPDTKWPVLPSDWSWGQVIGIFADSNGHVWTSSRSRISE